MSKKQRSISVRGTLYAKLKQYADAHGVSVASIVERALMSAPWLKPDGNHE